MLQRCNVVNVPMGGIITQVEIHGLRIILAQRTRIFRFPHLVKFFHIIYASKTAACYDTDLNDVTLSLTLTLTSFDSSGV